MAKRNPLIEIGVGFLLLRQNDVAADRASAGVFRATVRRFHDSRATSGHHGEAGLCEFSADLPSNAVIGMNFGKARRTENRHAWTGEMQGAKTAQELKKYPRRPRQLSQATLWPFEKLHHFRLAGRHPPTVDRDDLIVFHRHASPPSSYRKKSTFRLSCQ